MNPRPQAVITMDHDAALLEAGGWGIGRREIVLL
jgi:hypothetical protein